MVSLGSLWLPVLLSAVLVFIVSALVHMVLKYHNSDYKRLPNEDAVRVTQLNAVDPKASSKISVAVEPVRELVGGLAVAAGLAQRLCRPARRLERSPAVGGIIRYLGAFRGRPRLARRLRDLRAVPF